LQPQVELLGEHSAEVLAQLLSGVRVGCGGVAAGVPADMKFKLLVGYEHAAEPGVALVGLVKMPKLSEHATTRGRCGLGLVRHPAVHVGKVLGQEFHKRLVLLGCKPGGQAVPAAIVSVAGR